MAMELLRRGHEVYVGVLCKKEIDFVAIRQGEKLYIQVASIISEERAFGRKVSALLAISEGTASPTDAISIGARRAQQAKAHRFRCGPVATANRRETGAIR